MRVKRYVAGSMAEALPIIRSELGKDAVILNTKELKTGGFLGLFGKRKVEVIAAVEAALPPEPAAQQRKAPPPSSSNVRTLYAVKGEAAGPDSAQEAPAEPSAAARPAPESRPDPQQEQQLLKEIRELKAYVSRLPVTAASLSGPLRRLSDRLLAQEVAPALVDRLLDELRKKEQAGTETDAAQLWQAASRVLTGWLEPLVDEGIRPDTRVVHFVGPTGVGKTTTIAKLAAEQSIRNRRKIGFITSDTYRIAAVEQLRTYASILNAPMEVVISHADLDRAFRQLENCELIFMDTAGRNFRSELHVSEVNSLLRAGDRSDTYLVLSMTAKSADMTAIAGQFAKYGVTKALFTKLDETETYGGILNVVLEHQLKLAYITGGQTVPDDIEPFRADRYVAKLLGDAPDD